MNVLAFCWTTETDMVMPWISWRDLWRETAKTFGFEEYWVFDLRGVKAPLKLSNEPTLRGRYFVSTEVLQTLRTPVVHVCRAEGESLTTYSHPKDAVYVFGPDTGPEFSVRDAERVCIPTPVDYALWSFAAAAIVLYHRSSFRLVGLG
jgi:hypothetical protein